MSEVECSVEFPEKHPTTAFKSLQVVFSKLCRTGNARPLLRTGRKCYKSCQQAPFLIHYFCVLFGKNGYLKVKTASHPPAPDIPLQKIPEGNVKTWERLLWQSKKKGIRDSQARTQTLCPNLTLNTQSCSF